MTRRAFPPTTDRLVRQPWALPLAGLACIVLAACAPAGPTVISPEPAQPPSVPAAASPAPVQETPSPAAQIDEAPPPTATPAAATATRGPASATAAPALTLEPLPPAMPTSASTSSVPPTAAPTPEAAAPIAAASGPALVIDHTAIADFARIPDEAIARAAQLSFLFRGASVGVNMDDGLDCLMNNYPNRRPNFCDRGLTAEQVVFDARYDRSRWAFEPHSPPPNPNPGWWNKVTFFADRANSMDAGELYDVVTFTFDYVDVIEGGNMDDLFFQAERSGELPIVQDLADLEAAHPDQRFVWWTSNLARAVGTADAESFNQQMRAYAIANGKVLFDMAAIESHTPDGAPCFDNRGQGYPAICPDYTDEQEAGHLNARGRLRVAQALWVLMARLAGWEG